jgi:hypothetical protein
MSEEKAPITREPHRQFAQRLGVSTRTVDRWVERRILPEPERIRGWKYWDPGTQPRQDGRDHETAA